jgi:urea transport system permease protein
MVFLFNIFYQFGDSLAFLLLAAIGLAVIFGMMKIINLAHGEFITVGAYGTVVSGKVFNLPLPIAMAFGVIVTIIFGLILEKLVIRYLYGRPLDMGNKLNCFTILFSYFWTFLRRTTDSYG